MACVPKSSFPFKRLVPELRDMIWDYALLAESETRIVLVQDYAIHQGGIQVTKHLLSSFLLVNKESRERAKHFYSDAIDVYEQDLTGEDIVSVGKLYVSRIHDIFLNALEPVPNLGRLHAANGKFYTTTPSRQYSVGFDGLLRGTRVNEKCCYGAEKICFLIEYPRDHMWEDVQLSDIDVYDELAECYYKLAWIPTRDRRLGLLIPEGTAEALWFMIYQKVWTGLQAYLQTLDHECSFARYYEKPEEGGLDHSRVYDCEDNWDHKIVGDDQDSDGISIDSEDHLDAPLAGTGPLLTDDDEAEVEDEDEDGEDENEEDEGEGDEDEGLE
ncbi:hypothetical protein F5Y16DRAFT_400935 [Xylariaceae sp. FL0255]|nr:hypothetical protein F5Y16DRAFT_400935 [Xylariaceae sp. FL0255]